MHMNRRTSTPIVLVLVTAGFALTACGTEGGGDDDWNIRPDASTDVPDQPPPNDAGDTSDTRPDPDAGIYCDKQRAYGQGACRAILGVKFNGYGCVTMSGCSCEGPDCDETFQSVQACESHYNASNCQQREPVCDRHPDLPPLEGDGGGDGGDDGGAPCPPTYGWNGGQQCEPISSICRFECLRDNPPEKCDDVFLTQTSCGQVHQDVCPDDLCQAQDIQGEGGCSAVIGWRFDGRECQSVSGCSCTGSDCDEIYESSEACQQATNHCE
jgi:hypothetical protein